MAKTLNLTAPQTAIWLDHVSLASKPIYNSGQSVEITGQIDERIFVKSIQILVRECEALRSCFHVDGNNPKQDIREPFAAKVEIVDLSTANDPAAASLGWIEENFWKTISWSDFPLFRFTLIRLRENHRVWVQQYHHLIVDAIGRELVTRRVKHIYEALRNGTDPLPPAGTALNAAVDAEIRYRSSDRYEADRQYWLTRFTNLPGPLIEGDRRQTERARTGRPARLTFSIDRASFASLEALAKSQGSTTFKLIALNRPEFAGGSNS